MARRKKTVGVAQLVEQINRQNRFSTCDPKVRQGWNSMLESILHDTGNYNGFGLYGQGDLGKTITPAIRYEINDDGIPMPCADIQERFKDTDDTRIFFYL